MAENEQMVMFESESKVETKSTSKLKVLEKDVEELKRKVDLLYKSLRR